MSRTRSQNSRFEPGLSALLLASCAAFSAACSNGAAVDAPRGAGGAGGGDAGADSGGSEPQAVKIDFVPAELLELQPKESHQLTAQTTPAGPFRVRFAFEGGDPATEGGDPAADAVLDASEVLTDDDGFARVTLIAPSKPAKFSVRASSGGAQDHLGVSVSATGMTALSVHPSYSGRRQITKWTATASERHGAGCSDLAGNPPPDGDLLAPPAKPEAPLVIPKVRVGVDLTVTVRAGHYVGGCANLPALSEGDGNQVSIYASDRPLNLSETDLILSLGATDPHPEFDKLIQASVSVAESALLGSAKNDVEALLDEMGTETPAASREAFNVARSDNDWDSELESAFGKNAARRMRDPAVRWMTAGLLALNAPDALVGHVTALSGAASFTLSSVGTATPTNAGFPGFVLGTWSADSSDTLLLGMDLSWVPSRLVTALAVAPALLEFPDVTSAELALSRSVDCAQVGQVLVTYGVSPGSAALASCDQSCAMSLCSNAVAAAWRRAQLSSGTATATLSITASGTAQVGDDAQATKLDGGWVGELRTDDGTAQVSGALSASSDAR
ncbi:MAG: hypothetical protein WDO69_24670 [Pseudomonadota bacterium]